MSDRKLFDAWFPRDQEAACSGSASADEALSEGEDLHDFIASGEEGTPTFVFTEEDEDLFDDDSNSEPSIEEAIRHRERLERQNAFVCVPVEGPPKMNGNFF